MQRVVAVAARLVMPLGKVGFGVARIAGSCYRILRRPDGRDTTVPSQRPRSGTG